MRIPRLNIPISMACNLHCANCYALDYEYAQQRRKKFMTPEDVIGIRDNLDRCGVEVGKLTLAGAEPLMNPQFAEIAALVPTFKAERREVITNGTMLSWDHAIAMRNFTNIEISVYPISRGIRIALVDSGLVEVFGQYSAIRFRQLQRFRCYSQVIQVDDPQENYDKCRDKNLCTVAVEDGIYRCWVLFQLDREKCPYDPKRLARYINRKRPYENCATCGYANPEWHACGSLRHDVDAGVVQTGIKRIMRGK